MIDGANQCGVFKLDFINEILKNDDDCIFYYFINSHNFYKINFLLY